MRSLIDNENPSGFLIGLFILAIAGFVTPTAFADMCPVPTLAHPSIQAAVDDGACTEIVLAAQDFAESVTVSRNVEIGGDSSTTTMIEGKVEVTGAATEITLENLRVEGGGCFTVALDVSGGAQVTRGLDIVVVNAAGGECPIFTDGFELGAAVAWSKTVP